MSETNEEQYAWLTILWCYLCKRKFASRLYRSTCDLCRVSEPCSPTLTAESCWDSQPESRCWS